MAEQTETDPWAGFKASMEEFGKAMTRMGHVATARGAMGWAMRGELELARNTLAGLPPEVLREVSAAAAALASLADETIARG